MMYLLVIKLPGNTNMSIDKMHHAEHTERKVILEESKTTEFIFKEDTCGENCYEKNFKRCFRNGSKFSSHILRVTAKAKNCPSQKEQPCVNIHSPAWLLCQAG